MIGPLWQIEPRAWQAIGTRTPRRDRSWSRLGNVQGQVNLSIAVCAHCALAPAHLCAAIVTKMEGDHSVFRTRRLGWPFAFQCRHGPWQNLPWPWGLFPFFTPIEIQTLLLRDPLPNTHLVFYMEPCFTQTVFEAVSLRSLPSFHRRHSTPRRFWGLWWWEVLSCQGHYDPRHFETL